MTLDEIIKECVDAGIPVRLDIEELSVTGLAYIVSGFAKSGSARVFENAYGQIEVQTRYQGLDTVDNFEEIARVAYWWYMDYKERGYNPDCWASTFERFGWITKKTTITETWE